MTDKAYIVANEEQEREVLNRLDREGLSWVYSLKKPTAYKPSNYSNIVSFPYILEVLDSGITFGTLDELGNYNVVYDGRKENKMKISEEVYDVLVEWRDDHELQTTFISGSDLFHFPHKIVEWVKDTNTLFDNRNRLIAILQWLNNKDVFEVEKPKKWVVRSKEHNDFCEYTYITTDDIFGLAITMGIENATKFDTKEEAESWANSHQEVIEVEAE